MTQRIGFLWALAVALSASLPGHAARAALHPYHDRAAQIEVLLSSHELAEALGMEPVESLIHLGQGPTGHIGWSVASESCKLTVTLWPVPPQMPGPIAYRIEDLGSCE